MDRVKKKSILFMINLYTRPSQGARPAWTESNRPPDYVGGDIMNNSSTVVIMFK